MSTDTCPAVVLGVLGCISILVVNLSPLPTFCRIFRRKSTEDFQAAPYLFGLFKAMMFVYYACLKTNHPIMLIPINSAATCFQATYLVLYMIYAPRPAMIRTAKRLLQFHTVVYGGFVLFTLFALEGHRRVVIVGWVMAISSIGSYAAPLGIMRVVIRTKSVEYMPFLLSLTLTISALIWFMYGLLTRDHFIAVPNSVGILVGILQIILYYYIYKKPICQEREMKLQELPNHVVPVPSPENTNDKPAAAAEEAV